MSTFDDIPVVDLRKCEYDKQRKVLKLASEYFGMPMTFYVRSPKTGNKVRFIPVSIVDPLYDEDQWDGEQQVYRPVIDIDTVDHMVIYHQY